MLIGIIKSNNEKIMILEYGVKNYFCFKEWATISFKLNQQCPVEVSGGDDFTRILGIKGANSSGKTNMLKGLNFLSTFCCDSFSQKPDEDLGIVSFFYNDEPVELYVEFKCDDILYTYEVVLTQKKIHRETIYRTIKRESKIIERVNNELVVCNKNFNKLKKIKLRDNASIISTAHQYEIKELNSVYDFFDNIHTNVHMYGLNSESPEVSKVSEFLSKNEIYFDFVKKLIIKYDEAIKNIRILDRKDDEGNKVYFPIFDYDVKQDENILTFHTQSSGTQALFLQLAVYKFTLKHGGLLVLDEFDINLHPDILPDLLSLFINKDINKLNAQLIFTTHNTSILDFLGKYRSYLVNKENCESYTYRLDEIPGDILRNDRDIVPIYKSGKIGGIPKL